MRALLYLLLFIGVFFPGISYFKYRKARTFRGTGTGHTYNERIKKGIKEKDQMKLIDPDDYGPNVID